MYLFANWETYLDHIDYYYVCKMLPCIDSNIKWKRCRECLWWRMILQTTTDRRIDSPRKHSNWWRRTEHLFKATWRRRFANNFWRHLEDVLKTCWRRLAKTSWRRLWKTYCKHVLKNSWKTKNYYADDVFKTSWRHIGKPEMFTGERQATTKSSMPIIGRPTKD